MPRLPLAPLAAALALALAACGGDDEETPDPPRAGAPPATTRTAPPDEPRPARREPVDRLSLRQQVGQTIVFSFEGAEVPDYVRFILEEGRAAGVILFGDNVEDAGQVRRMTRTLQRAAGGGALVATDQEGGEIRILRFAPPEAGQGSQADVGAARDAAAAAAGALRRVGVNVNLAPVLDVASGAGSIIAGRGYPGGTGEVAALGRAAIRAHGRRDVGATAKHFPGLGAATENTDDAQVTIDSDRATIEGRDIPPFAAAIRARVPLVMSSHALYPALDRRRIASQSPRVMRGLLREQLGFRGVAITDSIEAEAVISRSNVATAALRSLRAGNDIVLSTGSGSYIQIYRRLLAAARRSPAVRARVRSAAARVLVLKRRLGLRLPR